MPVTLADEQRLLKDRWSRPLPDAAAAGTVAAAQPGRGPAALNVSLPSWLRRRPSASPLRLLWGTAAALGVLAVPLVLAAALSGGSTPASRAPFVGGYLPVHEQAGPLLFTAAQSSGFAGSDLGAALAATHLSARTSPIAGPDIFAPAIKESVAGDTAAMLADRQKKYAAYVKASVDPVAAGAPVPATRTEMIGWAVPGWTGAPQPGRDETVLLLARRPGADAYTTVVVTVVWDEAASDWKLRDTPIESGPTTSTDQFQAFYEE